MTLPPHGHHAGARVRDGAGSEVRRPVGTVARQRAVCTSARLREPVQATVDSVGRSRWDGDVDPLDAVFHHLDRWRHFPNYQLERRVDVFFSVYLKGLVEEFTGLALEDEIIPELPIKRDLIWPDLPTNKSVKVDYVLFAKDRSRVFFVELKTDRASRRNGQDIYLETAKRLGFRRIVEGIREIILNTTAHQKYHHLAFVLARLGYLRLPSDLRGHIYPVPHPRVLSRLAGIAVAEGDPAVEVIYIQPQATDGDRCIDFARVAEYVGRQSDPFSRRFAEHLVLWTAVAGSREPI
jgi:hypothetical protein